MEYRFSTSDKREHQFPRLRIAHRLYKKLGCTIGSWLSSPEWMLTRVREVNRYNDWCKSQLPVLEGRMASRYSEYMKNYGPETIDDTLIMKRFTKVV